MGVGPCLGDFVRPGLTCSYSKLWSALLGRHASPPRSSTTADNDVPPVGSGWSPHVIRDSHQGSFLEATISKHQALLCNCRDSDHCGVHVQPGLARAATSLEDYRLCLGLQPGLDVVQDVVKLGLYGILDPVVRGKNLFSSRSEFPCQAGQRAVN